ncbi:unnamed protein product [Discosporangium mesarthrocarpum]
MEPGPVIGWVALALGVAVTAVGGLGSWRLYRSLAKHKLL